MTAGAETARSALAGLAESSQDLRAVVVLDSEGAQVAHAGAGKPDEVAALARELVENVDQAAGERIGEVEVATGAGSVHALRGERLTVAAVAGRLAVSSLVRWHLRHTLGELERA